MEVEPAADADSTGAERKAVDHLMVGVTQDSFSFVVVHLGVGADVGFVGVGVASVGVAGK